jgi:hypothetical protein
MGLTSQSQMAGVRAEIVASGGAIKAFENSQVTYQGQSMTSSPFGLGKKLANKLQDPLEAKEIIAGAGQHPLAMSQK